MAPNRWELAKQREDEERERRRHEFPRWLTPLRLLAIFAGIATILLGIGLAVLAYDAPLRAPDLPQTSAVVTATPARKSHPVELRYSVNGRTYEATTHWRRHVPKVGERVTIAYVADDPTRIRPLGRLWRPKYPQLFILAGVFYITALTTSEIARRRRRRLNAPKVADAVVGSAEQPPQLQP